MPSSSFSDISSPLFPLLKSMLRCVVALNGRSPKLLVVLPASPELSCFRIWWRSQLDLVVNQSGQDLHLRKGKVGKNSGATHSMVYKGHKHKGPYLNEVYPIFGILDPLPPCLHSGKIHGTDSMHPLLLCLHLANPLPPLSVDVI